MDVEEYKQYLMSIETPLNTPKPTNVTAKKRDILFAWMWSVQKPWNMQYDTMMLAVHMVDVYFSKNDIPNNRIQLVSLAALLVASKYNELDACSVKDVCWLSDGAYDEQQVREMERMLLNACDYNVSLPLVSHFYDIMVHSGAVAAVDKGWERVQEITMKHELLYTGLTPSETAVAIQKYVDSKNDV
jgi:hypothetical protein